MMRSSKELKKIYPAIGISILTGILVMTLIRCKSPTSPNGQGEADIIVYSKFEETLDIYMDGKFLFSIEYKWSIEIDNVSLGEHELEAKERSTGVIVDTEVITVEEEIKYIWTIEDPPDINVTNQYEKTLQIYMDSEYQFDLVDEENRWIIDVPYGERFLKATRASDGKQVASTTIHVDENKDYSWTIE